MEEIIKIERLCAGYQEKKTISDISFSLRRGEILGIVGESGCGKSTLLKALMPQPNFGCTVFSGSVELGAKNLMVMDRKSLREVYGTKIGMVFQNPEGFFNPIRTFRAQFIETLKSHGLYEKGSSEAAIVEVFRSLGLEDGERILNSRPYEMSGGMNQRIAIAMAMLLKPDLLLADEPTSALDVTIQKQVVEELVKLRDTCKTGIIFVTHNIALVRHIADRIAILYAGKIVETGTCKAVFGNPQHPYTLALFAALPKLGGKALHGVEGIPPRDGAMMEACAFAPRCQYCDGRCNKQLQALHVISSEHATACPSFRTGRKQVMK